MANFYSQGVGGDHPDHVILKTVATINSQDILGNKSNVSIKVYAYHDGPYTPPNPTVGSQYLKIDDVSKISGSFNPNFEGTSETKPQLLMSWTGDIPHNADGTKTINIKAYQNCPNVSTLDYLYGSHNWTITTIPRASTPTLSAGTVALGSTVTISTNRASGTFTHKLKYSIGALNGSIADGVTDSYTWTLPATLAGAMTTTTSGTLKVICETYSGLTLVGSKEVSLTATVPNDLTYQPVATITSIVEGATGLSAFTKFIQGKSKLVVTSSGAGKYGATIAQIKVGVDSANYYGSPVTSAEISKSGTIPVLVTVTDSRGYTGTATQNVTIEPYAPPKINSFTAGRSPTDQGVDLSAPVDFTISSIGNQNTKRYILKYRESGGSWTTVIDSTAYYARSFTHAVAGALDTNKSYEVELSVQDSFATVIKTAPPISTAFELINFNASGKGIAFGKVSEIDGIEFALPTYRDGARTYMMTESGTNSNGRYVKFEDGTMIEWMSIVVTDQAISDAYGVLFQGIRTWTFPVAFYTVPAVTCSQFKWGTSASWGAVNTATTVASSLRGFDVLSRATGTTTSISAMAIGRWKE